LKLTRLGDFGAGDSIVESMISQGCIQKKCGVVGVPSISNQCKMAKVHEAFMSSIRHSESGQCETP
jgi:hypothetical protein